MSNWYILDDNHNPVPCDNSVERGLWESDPKNWIIQQTQIGEDPEHRVSTVFLFLDHSHRTGGPPVLFETMVFGGEHDQYQRRYETWAEAEKGHAETLAMVLGDQKSDPGYSGGKRFFAFKKESNGQS